MASSTSLTLSQALLARATSLHHGSTQSSTDRVSLSTFTGLKSSTTTPLISSSRRAANRRCASLPGLTRARPGVVKAVSVETAVDQAADTALVEKSINTIRFLAIDAVEKANSGHPGLPMGCAPMGHVLYDEVMRYNPKNPYWFNRDRFVLSAGHGCMLQYALLHLAGYDSVQVCPPHWTVFSPFFFFNLFSSVILALSHE